MSVETAMKAWSALRRLAGDSARIHITGGEPFLYSARMVEILKEAKREGLGPVDQIETNAYWADTRADIVGILKTLDSLGMARLKISCDPFHQEFIDIENVRRLADVARRALGDERVLVRWEKYADAPVPTAGLGWEEKAQHYRTSLGEYPCRFTGRAAGRLAEALACRSIEDFADSDCSVVFLGAKGIHVDPFGNVFSGTCSGITVGNINDKPLNQMWCDFDPPNVPAIGWLFKAGPVALAREAEEDGFRPAARYAGKCHLCSSVRKFFFDKGRFAAIIGPVQCYSEGKDTSHPTCKCGIDLSGEHGA